MLSKLRTQTRQIFLFHQKQNRRLCQILELEAENKNLKNELQDTQETVEIMKLVLSKYTKQS